jgi:hypothetical protein
VGVKELVDVLRTPLTQALSPKGRGDIILEKTKTETKEEVPWLIFQ